MTTHEHDDTPTAKAFAVMTAWTDNPDTVAGAQEPLGAYLREGGQIAAAVLLTGMIDLAGQLLKKLEQATGTDMHAILEGCDTTVH